MTDLNKTDIKLVKSQRLDDTDQGGGQMIGGPLSEVISGGVNQLYPDISRLDRVYGRVSLRKSYLGVQTTGQQVYYGSHSVLTRNAKDPNVSVCFFTSSSWFDTRKAAQQRIESYLVKGPMYPAALWGPHFLGTRQVSMFTEPTWPAPQIGDVLVLVKNENQASEEYQYVRVTNVTEEVRDFSNYYNGSTSYFKKKVLTLEIGNQLLYDFTGQEVTSGWAYTNNNTKIYTTVAADASRYYGVTELRDNAIQGGLQIRVKEVNVPLVPSAQSQTAITDAGVGQSVTPMLQTDSAITSVVRSIGYSITNNSRLYIGEGILPGSFTWTGGVSMYDDSLGNIYSGSTIIGSITYATGVIDFTNVSGSTSGTGTATYKPACAPTLVSNTGGIQIETNNRGFVFTYICDPLPKIGTLKIDYYSSGKWYSLQDRGDGGLRGSDPSIGSGSVNFITGSVSLTLGAMPDVGSMILFFWGTNAPFYNLNGETLSLHYKSKTHDEGIAQGSFVCSWLSNTYAAVDDGDGNLVIGSWSGTVWNTTATVIGSIKYATGDFEFTVHASQGVPASTESFAISYSFGNKYQETFNPIRNGDGTITMYLTNTPVRPTTMRVEWHTKQVEYYDAEDVGSIISVKSVDPTHTFQDDGVGGFKFETIIMMDITHYFQSNINYATGKLQFMPDRVGVFPLPIYRWTNQSVMNLNTPTAEPTRMFVFDHMQYLSAAALWPTDGIIVVDYCTSNGANVTSYTEQMNKCFYVKDGSYLQLVPGSLSFTAGAYYITESLGKLFRSIAGTTGIGIECGSVDYAKREITINDDAITNRTITIVSASGMAGIDPVQMILFRTPGAPITPGSLGIQATTDDGTHVTGTSDFSGNITGNLVTGKIDFDTGIGRVTFGEWVQDTFTALPVQDRPIWYNSDLIDAGDIFKPASVSASTVSINCVVSSYLPLDADLLGLDPVRLPLDGKVPIFRDGNILLIHHTINQNLPNPLVAGTTYTLTRSNVNLIEVYDSTGKYYPETNGITQNYSVDLAAGTIIMGASPSFVGFTAPFYAIHRIEDMCLASDVQITGHIAITNPLSHNYPANDTLVSSVLPSKDLQARAYNEFVQTSWTGVWSDDIIGSSPLSKFNFVDYPLTVKNNGATKERWLLKFKTSTTFDIIGENLGVIAADVQTTGHPGNLISPISILTGQPYWELNELGFGVGWSAGNCIRFNTDAANFPIWFVRTTLQAPPTEPVDSYEFQIRGDSA